MDIKDQEEGYRRGLVLGFTMAEVFILILFCLLLVLAFRMSLHQQEIERQTALILIQSEQLALFDQLSLLDQGDLRLVQDLKEYWERYGPSETGMREYFSQLVLQAQELAELRKRLEELVEKNSSLEEQLTSVEVSRHRINSELETLRPKLEAMKELDEFLASHQINPALEDDRRYIENALATMQMIQTGGQGLEEVAEALVQLQSEVGGLTNLIGYYERLYGFPPCWHDGEWRIDYTFDVTVTSQGFVMRTVPQSRHENHPIMGAVREVTSGRQISPVQFARETKPIYDWSVTNQCRFFVTVYDGTAENEKRIFQERMRVLEGHFYKRERLNVTPPF